MAHSSNKNFQMSQDDIDFVRNLLRQGSTKWPGRAECLRLSRKRVLIRYSKTGQPVYKYFWQCASCRQWYRDVKSVEVDHVSEIGSFNGDWNEYLFKHFPRPIAEKMQVLCIACHLKKTKAFNSARSKWKRK